MNLGVSLGKKNKKDTRMKSRREKDSGGWKFEQTALESGKSKTKVDSMCAEVCSLVIHGSWVFTGWRSPSFSTVTNTCFCS